MCVEISRILSDLHIREFPQFHLGRGGTGSVVGIATAYGLDGPGIESR